MKITALEEYGLRCVLRLAMKPGGGPLTVAEIAEQEGLTVPYVGKLMSVLRQSGLVESFRGRSGGYVLARPATEISVEEALSSLGEPLFASDYCESHPGVLAVCSHHGDCSIRSIWQVLGEMIHRVLRGTTLADLCMQEGRLANRFKDSFEPVLLDLGGGSVSQGGGGSCTTSETAKNGAGVLTMASAASMPVVTGVAVRGRAAPMPGEPARTVPAVVATMPAGVTAEPQHGGSGATAGPDTPTATGMDAGAAPGK